MTGNSLSLNVALGGAVNTHLMVFGMLMASAVRHATSTIDGPSPSGVAGMLTSATYGGMNAASVQGVGPGVAYYFDSNVFLAGSLLASRLRFYQSVGAVFDSSWGLTLDAQVGKEWWVSDNWGLGLAGQVLLGAMKDGAYGGGSVPTWKFAEFSLLFSATFN